MTSQSLPAQAPAASSALSWNHVKALVFGTRADSSAIVLRLGLAAVFWPHGAQKLLGWFGGYGFDGTMGFLTKTMGLPYPIALLTVLIEFFAPFLLLAGLFTRGAALGIVAVMIGAIATVHAPYGFFMNWSGTQAGEGFEYHLLAIAIALALLVRGGGSYSVDRAIARFEPA